LFVTLSTSSAYAGFPVLKNTVETSEMASSTESSDEVVSAVAYAGYDKWVAVALWFFLGGFAAHRWYAKKPAGWNILFILTLGGIGIWAIIDLINILTDNFE